MDLRDFDSFKYCTSYVLKHKSSKHTFLFSPCSGVVHAFYPWDLRSINSECGSHHADLSGWWWCSHHWCWCLISPSFESRNSKKRFAELQTVIEGKQKEEKAHEEDGLLISDRWDSCPHAMLAGNPNPMSSGVVACVRDCSEHNYRS